VVFFHPEIKTCLHLIKVWFNVPTIPQQNAASRQNPRDGHGPESGATSRKATQERKKQNSQPPEQQDVKKTSTARPG